MNIIFVLIIVIQKPHIATCKNVFCKLTLIEWQLQNYIYPFDLNNNITTENLTCIANVIFSLKSFHCIVQNYSKFVLKIQFLNPIKIINAWRLPMNEESIIHNGSFACFGCLQPSIMQQTPLQ